MRSPGVVLLGNKILCQSSHRTNSYLVLAVRQVISLQLEKGGGPGEQLAGSLI